MQLSDIERMEEVVALLEIFRRLASCAHHHINTYESIRHTFLDELYLMSEECLVVSAMHQFEHLVASTLQGNMEMRHKPLTCGTELNEFVG